MPIHCYNRASLSIFFVKIMSHFENALTELLQLSLPICQAPLPFELIPANYSGQISKHGAMGLLRVSAYATDEQLEQAIARYRNQHHGLHLSFHHQLPHTPNPALPSEYAQIQFADYAPDDYRPPLLSPASGFNGLLKLALKHRPISIAFACGLPEADVIADIRAQGVKVLAFCRNLLEALVAQRHQVDAIILQGAEAGGERVGFSNALHTPEISAHSLLQQARAVITLPLIVWGEYTDSCDIVAMLLAGAAAVMMDRPFLACQESGLTVAQHDTLKTLNEYHSHFTHRYTARAMRHSAIDAPLPAPVESEGEEVLWQQWFKAYPDMRPLPISSSEIALPNTLAALLAHFQQGINQYLV